MNAMTLPAWVDAGAASAIAPRTARRILTPLGEVAIFRTGDDRYFALVDRCPHKGGPLSQGIVHGHSVTCPLHAVAIDLATGAALGDDAHLGCAPSVPVEVREGRLFLRMPA